MYYVRGVKGWFHKAVEDRGWDRTPTACGTSVMPWDQRTRVSEQLVCPECRKVGADGSAETTEHSS